MAGRVDKLINCQETRVPVSDPGHLGEEGNIFLFKLVTFKRFNLKTAQKCVRWKYEELL